MLKKTKFLIITFTTIALLIASCVIIYSIKTESVYFGENSVFKNVESEKLIDVVNATENPDDNSVKIEAIFCDQVNTYVKISASGSDFDGQTPIDSYVEYARMLNNDGKSWFLCDDDSYTSNGDFKANETILVFAGGPDQDTNIDLILKFTNLDKEVVFEKINVHVQKAVIRDVTESNYFINLPCVKGRISKIIYTPLKTQFRITWNYDNINDFNSNYTEFVGDNMMKVSSVSGECETLFFPHYENSETPKTEGIYDVYHRFSSDEALTVDLFSFDDIKSNMVFSKTLVTIR